LIINVLQQKHLKINGLQVISVLRFVSLFPLASSSFCSIPSKFSKYFSTSLTPTRLAKHQHEGKTVSWAAIHPI